jgi:DNA-binding NarL/FixJ family response regulator
VALIDPKPLTRRSIEDLFAKAFREYAMVAASTCEEMLEIAETRIGRPDLVVLYVRDVGLTNTCVQSALELLRVRLPEASTVVLSDRDDVDAVNRALAHGMRGYIPTSVEWEVAEAALRLISAGGTFVPADAFRSTAAKPDDQPEGERQRRSDGLDLTPRELSVIDLLREGKPNKLIAARLDMQENTVKVHVRNILKKLNATNRTHAAFVANRLLGGVPIRLSAVRTRGSQEAGCRSRGVEFAPDSPLEGDGFEPSVPRIGTTVSRAPRVEHLITFSPCHSYYC